MLEDILDNASRKLETTKIAQTRVRDTERFTTNMTKVLQSLMTMDLYLKTVATAEANRLMDVSVDSIMRNDIIASLQMVLSETLEGYLEATTVSSVSKNVSAFKRHLDSLWVNSLKNSTEQVISLLNTFSQFMTNESEAISIATTLENGITSFPINPSDVITFKAKLQKGREMADQIGADDDIKIFIGKVRDLQATLEDITPKVQEWIYKHDIPKRIKIIFF
ncbi:hypothetical protein [Desulfosporosinus shakirovi]|uniref:hypothetical protein n=1 Tax=Desulfosporosinus shakirovi TaxID=2885154 RepID=UPI001E50129A|nr:hypothetical protein [Desulfosporosinus sp. SRJS8]MCB8814726.1 hypothetical protein [Desulfosporosinus sp. SRJS8]